MSNGCYNMPWSLEDRQIGRAYLGLAIPALLFHILFWTQVATHRVLRQSSMLWVYNYLLTDFVILVQLFIEYILRTTLPDCVSYSIYSIFCNIEAYVPAYMTILEAYSLVCLNVTRYYLIVKNVDISNRYPYILILTNVFLYVFGISIFVIQVELVQTVKLRSHDHTQSCFFQYLTMKTQIINLIIVLLIPIILNCYLMTLTIIHVRQSQLAVRSQRSKHLPLLVQFFVVYLLWLILWAPNVAISYFIWNNYTSAYIRFGSLISAVCNPFIFMFVDRRFLKVWKETFYRIRHCGRPSRQIRPTTVSNEIRMSTVIK